MADFCKQCSLENFGKDYGDLTGLISKEEVDAGYCVTGICEGCAHGQFDHEGRCLHPDCNG